MADDRNARNEQADNEERRQRKRELEEARDRADEAEPPRDDPGERLGDLDEALANHDYPAKIDELIDAYGDRKVETRDGTRSIGDVLTSVDDETFESAADARNQILRQINRR